MPLEALAAQHGGLREFRVDSRTEIRNLLRALQDGASRVHLNAANGIVYSTTVWTLDTQRETVSFAADGDERRLSGLIEAMECVAVAYLDSVKLQFDVSELTIVRGSNSATLRAPFPGLVYRFQRRSAFRVKTGLRTGTRARLRLAQFPDAPIELRLLDVSLGGCALLLPSDMPMVKAGDVFNRVVIDLDPMTRLETGLRVQHVSALGPEAPGVRLGCAFHSLGGESLRTLQRYLDQSQRQRRFMSLS